MTSRSSFRLGLTMIPAVCIVGCSSSTSPSSNAVADFLTGVTASDGTVAAMESGAPPAPSGGPTLTVTSSGSVSSGGNDAASLQASSPFQTVYVSVGGASGFYQLQLATATTSITVTDGLASQIPTNSYVASYEVASSSGQVGAPASVTNTVQPAPTVVVGTWIGTYTLTFASSPPSSGTMQWQLTQDGNSSHGTYTGNVPPVTSGSVQLSSSGGSVLFNLAFSCTIPGEMGSFNSSYQLSGNTLTGSATTGSTALFCDMNGDNPRGLTGISFSLNKQ